MEGEGQHHETTLRGSAAGEQHTEGRVGRGKIGEGIRWHPVDSWGQSSAGCEYLRQVEKQIKRTSKSVVMKCATMIYIRLSHAS